MEINEITYKNVTNADKKSIELIASWYLMEWNTPIEITIKQFSNFNVGNIPFQVLMLLDNEPIATGGIYNHVGLLDREPRFKIYNPWLALVYTTPENRGKGYGALLCKKIEALSKTIGLNEIFLFTHTAESLYKRLDWQEIERIELNGKNIVVMKKYI
jgi:GNAT superfamily N-acetyltransferase